MSKEKEVIQTTLRIDSDLLNTLGKHAEKIQISRNAYINMLLVQAHTQQVQIENMVKSPELTEFLKSALKKTD